MLIVYWLLIHVSSQRAGIVSGKGSNVQGTRLWLLPLILLLVTAIWLASGFFLYSREDRGTIGDMFGAVNSLFSGLAFAALIYTVFMQREELALQREDLKETREELKRSATAQEASEKALYAQAKAAAQSANLAAVNSLLGYYREEITAINKNSSSFHADEELQLIVLHERQTALLGILESTYQHITSKHTR